jgi:predicted nucleotidyltransferase
MTLLQQMHQDRKARREALRLQVREQLREALEELRPEKEVIVFGSLTKPGRFNESSDIDLALEREPAGMSVCQLTSLLAERLGRRVDVLVLPETRLRGKIKCEGEVWTLRGF